MKIRDSFNDVFGKVKKVLVVTAHPDDLELICGGTVARLTDKGVKVRSVVMTNGGKGMKDRSDVTEEEFAKLRIAEQKEADVEIGIPKKENFNFDIPDGELETSLENIEKVVFHIRQFKPDAVITHNPEPKIVKFSEDTYWVNHRDHRNCGIVTMDAMYPYSRDRGFFPQHFSKDDLEPHSVNHLLFSDAYSDPQLNYFDIKDFVEQRRKALMKHKNAFTKKNVDGLMEEVQMGSGYFEPLGHIEIY